MSDETATAPLPIVADVEHDGDRGPRAPASSPVPDLLAAAVALSREDLRALLWIARTLPGLEARCRAIKLEATEPAYQADGKTPTANDFKHATPRGHVALGALLSLVRAWRVAGAP